MRETHLFFLMLFVLYIFSELSKISNFITFSNLQTGQGKIARLVTPKGNRSQNLPSRRRNSPLKKCATGFARVETGAHGTGSS